LINIEWQLGFAVDNVAIFATENMEKPHETLEKMETSGMEIQKNMETSGKLTIFFQGFHPFHPQNWGFSQEQMPRNADFCMNNWDFTTNHESLVGGKTHHFPEGFEASKIGVYDVT
jgi:hypothetical protein